MLGDEETVAVVDMEAGLEHLSRGTERGVDQLLVMLEPYYKALETARRAAELGRELGIPHVAGVANKVRDDTDRDAVRDFAERHELEILAEVPYDDEVRRADLEGRAPYELGAIPAVEAVERLADRLGFRA